MEMCSERSSWLTAHMFNPSASLGLVQQPPTILKLCKKNKTFHITFRTGLARHPTIWHDGQPNNRDVGASRKPIGEVGCCEPRMAERIH